LPPAQNAVLAAVRTIFIASPVRTNDRYVFIPVKEGADLPCNASSGFVADGGDADRGGRPELVVAAVLVGDEHIDAYVRFAKLRYRGLLGQVVAWDRAI
jgi:hypothetical protein